VPRVVIAAGAQKSASTSVTKWLADMPGVDLLGWECIAFEGRAHTARTRRLAAQVSRSAGRGQVALVHRPEIFHTAALNERAGLAFPDAVVVVVLRNPVDRAVSAWWHYRRIGVLERRISLRECVRRWESCGSATPAGQVVEYSRYSIAARSIRRSFRSTHLAFNEDVLINPRTAFAAALNELGLEDVATANLPRVNTRDDVERRAGAVPPRLLGHLSFRWDQDERHIAPRAVGWRAAALVSRSAALLGIGTRRVAEDGRVTQDDRDAVFGAVSSDMDQLEQDLERLVPSSWRNPELARS
jgi:hypothetical protein